MCLRIYSLPVMRFVRKHADALRRVPGVVNCLSVRHSGLGVAEVGVPRRSWTSRRRNDAAMDGPA